MRIAITGSAGTGKSTLACALSERLGLALVPEGMREYLERTGVDLHDLGPEGLKAVVLQLWRERQQAEDTERFVADRCSVDFATFWLYYRFEFDPGTAEIQAAFARHAERYDRVVVLPHGSITLAHDGVRVTNPWTQLHFQLLLEGMLARTVPPAKLLRVPPQLHSLEERLGWLLPRLG
jgi:nicotinamide riboside kinase